MFTGVLDKNGDFFCGVADMSVLEYIPPAHLDKSKFWESKVLVIDSNIGEQTLEYILSKDLKCQHIIYEPISMEKSERILKKDYLSQITCFKPNILQLQHLVKVINQSVGEEKKDELFQLSGDMKQDIRLIKLMMLEIKRYADKQSDHSKLN